MKDCETCGAYLGGGLCKDNLEGECREGGGYEAHRPGKIHLPSLWAVAQYAGERGIREGGFSAVRLEDGSYVLEEKRNAQ